MVLEEGRQIFGVLLLAGEDLIRLAAEFDNALGDEAGMWISSVACSRNSAATGAA